jgi:hypothetical protein
MHPPAKVIAFPARAQFDPTPQAPALDSGEASQKARGRKVKSWLVWLLAPLILAASLLLFLAVVGVWLVWLIIVSLLVACVIIFARRLIRRLPGGFRRWTIG